jgi:hypothetical protein
MLAQLEAFRSGESRLDRVLAALEQLLDELPASARDWSVEVRDVHDELHARYATALDHQGSVPTISDSDVADVVDDLARLIQARLAEATS